MHDTTFNRDDDVILMLFCVCVSESVLTLFDFVRCSVDENVERPHHAGDGDDMEGDRTHNLPPLARRHLELLPLRQRARGYKERTFEEVKMRHQQSIRTHRCMHTLKNILEILKMFALLAKIKRSITHTRQGE